MPVRKIGPEHIRDAMEQGYVFLRLEKIKSRKDMLP